jgi:hypothetical protein
MHERDQRNLPEVFELHPATGKEPGALVRKADMPLDEPVAQVAIPGALILDEIREVRSVGDGG